METKQIQQPTNAVIGITIMVILLVLYSFRSTSVNDIHMEESSVSLCQVHFRYDASDTFTDQTLLSILATLKMHDFQIGQPVWGPSDNLLYLCEHRLKTGLKQTIIDKELNNIIKNAGLTSKHVVWSCA